MCMKAGVTVCDKDQVCGDKLEREIKYWTKILYNSLLYCDGNCSPKVFLAGGRRSGTIWRLTTRRSCGGSTRSWRRGTSSSARSTPRPWRGVGCTTRTCSTRRGASRTKPSK